MSSQNKFYLDTKIVGILGYPIKHSYSPLIHNMSFNLTESDFIYLPFEVHPDNLGSAMSGLSAIGIKGFNVTIPHKETIIEYLNDISQEARIIGAVNSVVNKGGEFIGYNTDAHGIVESLLPYKSVIAGETVCIIGAGGAARSAVYSLIKYFKPASISLLNRGIKRADNLIEHFSSMMEYKNFFSLKLNSNAALESIKSSKLIINATSVGMNPNSGESPVEEKEAFHNGQIVFDIVYNPVRTRFLKIAQSMGASTINGLTMFVSQAAKAFNLWTGKEMPSDKIMKALTVYLSE